MIKKFALEGSQYGDARSLSSICTDFVQGTPLVASGSWTGTLQLWDGSSPVLSKLGEQKMCHEDRIMGLAMQTINDGESALISTASIDLTAKLWKAKKSDVVMTDNDIDDPKSPAADDRVFFSISKSF